MLCDLLQAKLVWMPSVCYTPNYYLQNCIYLYLVPLLLNRIGNLLAYVAALLVTSVCRWLSLRGWVVSAWDSKTLDCSRSQIESRPSRIRGLFHFFLLHFRELFFAVFSLVFAKRSFALVLILLADLVDKQKQNNPARSLYSHEIHQKQKILTAFSRHSWYLIFLGKQKKLKFKENQVPPHFLWSEQTKKIA